MAPSWVIEMLAAFVGVGGRVSVALWLENEISSIGICGILAGLSGEEKINNGYFS